MTLSQFWTVLKARWLSGLVVFLAVVAVAVALSLLLPKSYTASSSVLIDMKSPDPVAGNVTSIVPPGYMATQADLIQSERVARRAISALRLDTNAELRSDWQDETKGVGDYQSWVATTLAKRLEIKPSRESNVLSISYSSRDPGFSAAVVNAYVKGYVDTTLELKTEPARESNAFFDERAKKFRQELEAAQTRLSEFQRSKGIVANDERLDIENMRLSEISSQVVALETAAADAGSRQSQAGATPERMQEVLGNPVVAGLQADLARQEVKLEELSTRLGDANPQVIEARGTVATLRARLQSAIQRASGSVTVSSNVANSRLAQLRAARDEQRTKVLKLKGSRDEVSVLQRDVESAQRAYDVAMARASQTGLESRVTQTNVSVIKSATPPPNESFPLIWLNLAIGAVAGLVLALGTSLTRELLDPRLRTVQDVTQVLKQPLLITMPKPPGAKKRRTDSARAADLRLNGAHQSTSLAR
jgi:succinoglycan biosynthesis transport protein ExoP